DRTAVLIHGITSDSGSWCRFGPDLAARGYHVVAVDLRGHGLSPRGEYGPEAWADDVLESVPAKPDLALGHSLGGRVRGVGVQWLRCARDGDEDPGGPGRPPRQAQAAQEFVAQKGWGREQVVAANPRWPAADIAAKLEALSRWDPDTAPGVLNG